MDGVADLFFLIMTRVIAALAAQDQRTGQLRMPELAMGAFAAWYKNESCMLKVGDQLANLARHTAETIIPSPAAPAPNRLPEGETSLRFVLRWRIRQAFLPASRVDF